MRKISVIGAGSWGTTIANLLGDKGFEVGLWVRESWLYESIKKDKENATFLPGVRLSDNITAHDSFARCTEGAFMVVCAVPSHGIRDVFGKGSIDVPKDAIVVSASKGIEQDSFKTGSAILKDVLPAELGTKISAISGPTFAKEVSAGLPAAACAASRLPEVAKKIQEAFSTEHFRIYTNTDIVGVEYGGALKNVIAIASGISDGLELGTNARAALITRGLAEMARLGTSMGAEKATFSGLSGLGDLVLTCTGPLSRNRTVGLEVGRGRSIDEILSKMKMVAEGVKTSRSVKEFAESKGIEMPITEEVYMVLHEGKPPAVAVKELMSRELKDE